MIEHGHFAELLQKLGIRQYHPDFFTSSYNPRLEEQIAGFTTLSLNYVQNSLSSKTPAIKPYCFGHINLDLTTTAYNKTFGHDPTRPTVAAQLISDNRDHGKWWCVYEFLINDPRYNQHRLKFHEKVNFDTDLVHLAFHPQALQLYGAYNPKLIELITNHDINTIRHQPAAQVLYRPEIIDYINSRKHTKVDDQSVRIHAPIPMEFIYGISVINYS
jgi:hypothetical protein